MKRTQNLRGTHHLHFQDQRVSQASVTQFATSELCGIITQETLFLKATAMSTSYPYHTMHEFSCMETLQLLSTIGI
jgi:hypothetical protein